MRTWLLAGCEASTSVVGSSDVGAGLHRGCVAMSRPDAGTPPTGKLSTDANFAALTKRSRLAYTELTTGEAVVTV